MSCGTRPAVTVALSALAVVAGVLVATVPVTQTRSFGGDGVSSFEAQVRCGAPVLDLLGRYDGSWVAHAPNTGVRQSPSPMPCRPESQWRVAVGAALVGAGLVGAWSSRRTGRIASPALQATRT